MTRSIAADDGVTSWLVDDVVARAKDLGSSDLSFFTVPVAGTGTSSDGQSIVELDPARLALLMRAVRDDAMPTYLADTPPTSTSCPRSPRDRSGDGGGDRAHGDGRGPTGPVAPAARRGRRLPALRAPSAGRDPSVRGGPTPVRRHRGLRAVAAARPAPGATAAARRRRPRRLLARWPSARVGPGRACSPSTWRAELAAQPVDLLFVESAWIGNGGAWRYRLTGTSAPRPGVRRARRSACRERGRADGLLEQGGPGPLRGLPRDRGRSSTTSSPPTPTVPRPLPGRLGHDRVGVLAFAAQPAVHNPVRSGTAGHQHRDVAFAGMYFAHQLPRAARADGPAPRRGARRVGRGWSTGSRSSPGARRRRAATSSRAPLRRPRRRLARTTTAC